MDSALQRARGVRCLGRRRPWLVSCASRGCHGPAVAELRGAGASRRWPAPQNGFPSRSVAGPVASTHWGHLLHAVGLESCRLWRSAGGEFEAVASGRMRLCAHARARRTDVSAGPQNEPPTPHVRPRLARCCADLPFSVAARARVSRQACRSQRPRSACVILSRGVLGHDVGDARGRWREESLRLGYGLSKAHSHPEVSYLTPTPV